MAIRGLIGILALAGLLMLSVSAPVRADTPLLFLPSFSAGPVDNRITVLHPGTREVIHELPVAGQPEYIAVDHVGGRVFVSVPDDSQLLVLDANSGTLMDTIATDYEPRWLHVDQFSDELWIGARMPEDALYARDLQTLEPLRTVDLTSLRLNTFALFPEIFAAFVQQSGDGIRTLTMVDTIVGFPIDTFEFESGIHEMMGVDRIGSRLISSDSSGIRVHRIGLNGFEGHFYSEFPFIPTSMLVDEDNRRLYLGDFNNFMAVDLDLLYATEPDALDDIAHFTADITGGGPMDIGEHDNRLYVIDFIPGSPVPPGDDEPSDTRGFGNQITIADPATLDIFDSFHANAGAVMISEGRFTAGQALPAAPAIPTLGPVGIGVLILLIAAMAVRRYPLRARYRG